MPGPGTGRARRSRRSSACGPKRPMASANRGLFSSRTVRTRRPSAVRALGAASHVWAAHALTAHSVPKASASPFAPKARKPRYDGGFGVARPGLEPGTPRFSAACPPQANVADLQRNREHVLGRRIREDSRNFVAIADFSGTRSRTCAQMTSEPQLPASWHPGVGRSARPRVGRYRGHEPDEPPERGAEVAVAVCCWSMTRSPVAGPSSASPPPWPVQAPRWSRYSSLSTCAMSRTR